jgi:GDP-mannose 6-dehydrogenase
MLIGKGYDLRIFDSNVEYARVFGTNKEYIESKIPHVSSLLCQELDEVVGESDVLIIGNGDKRFAEAMNNAGDDKLFIDLFGFMAHTSTATREGICW